jgi:beta-fructofuranosidase
MTKISSQLAEANRFVQEYKDSIHPQYRYNYHVMAPIGWINDPNGFVYFKGEYHIFYQYYPYDSKWGPMHWGHSKSKDLINWEELPVALAPDQTYDKDGCFSGSAIEKDGKLYLMYTGHVYDEGVGVTYQTQCMAVSEDGIHFTKMEQNPVIDQRQLGENGDIHDFRDPKVFQREGCYYSVLATKTKDERGKILLFESKDLIEWSFTSVLLEGQKGQGVMWECPDLFHLDGKDVLIMSPIQIEPKAFEFYNTSSTVAFIGKMNWENGEFQVENYHEIDFGLDFYAPQTLEDDQNRRIMIAWMQMWHRTLPTDDLGHKWVGAMTLPRELHVKENCLVQKPITSIYDYLTIQEEWSEMTLNDTTETKEDIIQNTTYLKMTATFEEKSALTIEFAKKDQAHLLFNYDANTEEFTLSREFIGLPITGIENETLVERKVQIPLINKKLEIEIFRDTTSVEVFINGTTTITTTFYETEVGKDLSFTSKENVKLSKVKIGTIKN